ARPAALLFSADGKALDLATLRAGLIPVSANCRVIDIFSSGLQYLSVDLPSRTARGQGDSELLCEFQREDHVFVHEPQWKTRGIFALEKQGRLDIEDGRAPHACLHYFDEALAGNPSGLGQGQSFGEGLD